MPGLRFDHRWTEDPAAGRRPGIGLTPRGQLALVGGGDEVRQALIMLLSTRPGERVMRPDYGCPLHRLVFAPMDATTEGLAIHYVRDAVERWEPRVALGRVDAAPSAAPGVLEVALTYTVRATTRRETLVFTVDLFGAED